MLSRLSHLSAHHGSAEHCGYQLPEGRRSRRDSRGASPAGVARDPEAVDFEKLLGDLSASFIRVSLEEIETEMERWLQRIVLAMDVDRGNMAQLDPADGTLYTRHQWGREGALVQFESK
jgi:hypothetical protein